MVILLNYAHFHLFPWYRFLEALKLFEAGFQCLLLISHLSLLRYIIHVINLNYWNCKFRRVEFLFGLARKWFNQSFSLSYELVQVSSFLVLANLVVELLEYNMLYPISMLPYLSIGASQIGTFFFRFLLWKGLL